MIFGWSPLPPLTRGPPGPNAPGEIVSLEFDPALLAALDQESAAMQQSMDSLLVEINKNLIKDNNQHATILTLAQEFPQMCRNDLKIMCLYAANALVRLAKERS